MGELLAARTYYERALPILKTRLGSDHSDTARVLNNLGAALGGLGELDAARDAHHRTQAILEAQLGPDHPYTASNRSGGRRRAAGRMTVMPRGAGTVGHPCCSLPSANAIVR
jgi:hypothetical protein